MDARNTEKITLVPFDYSSTQSIVLADRRIACLSGFLSGIMEGREMDLAEESIVLNHTSCNYSAVKRAVLFLETFREHESELSRFKNYAMPSAALPAEQREAHANTLTNLQNLVNRINTFQNEFFGDMSIQELANLLALSLFLDIPSMQKLCIERLSNELFKCGDAEELHNILRLDITHLEPAESSKVRVLMLSHPYSGARGLVICHLLFERMTRNAGFLNMIGNEEIVKLILDDFEYRSKLEVDQLLTRISFAESKLASIAALGSSRYFGVKYVEMGLRRQLSGDNYQVRLAAQKALNDLGCITGNGETARCLMTMTSSLFSPSTVYAAAALSGK